MKKLYFLLFTLLPACLYAQNFSLKGTTATHHKDKKIFLIHVSQTGEVIDSTVIKNGHFEFNMPLKEASVALLLLDHTGTSLKDKNPKDVFRFYIEPGNATLTTTDSIAKAQVAGLPIFGTMEAFNTITKPLENKLVQLNQAFNALSENKKTDEKVTLGFQDRYTRLMEERNTAIKNFVKTYPQSYISLYTLNVDLATEDMDVPEIQGLFDNLSPSLKGNVFANNLLAKLESAKTTGIGVLATDFEEKTPEGIAIKLSSYRGQYVLVDFWASWCGPCRQENPNLVLAYEKYKSKNFTVLGVSIDENAAAWKKAVKEDELLWTQLMDNSKQIAQIYRIDAIPKNYLIDPQGKIIAKNLRGAALHAKLKEILEQH